MRYFKKIFLWICISLVFQVIIFYLADKYIMIKEDVRIYKLNYKEKQDIEKITIGMKCQASWEKFQCSYDGRYISYLDGKNLYVYDCTTKSRKMVPFEGNHQLAYHMWIPQRERMIIIEKINRGSEVVFSISYYDANTSEKRNVKDISHEQKDAYVQDVEGSLLTGAIYINVVSGKDKSNLYRIDISENIMPIDTTNYFIDKLSLVESMDRLIYEDKLNNKIFYVDFPYNIVEEIKVRGNQSEESTDPEDLDREDYERSQEQNKQEQNTQEQNTEEQNKQEDNKKKNKKNSGKEKLLGSNDLGEVYIGILENGGVEELYISTGDLELKNWNYKKLNKAAREENIYICENGGFYVSYPEENKIIYYNGNVKTEKELKGKVVDYYDKGFIYMNDNHELLSEEVLQ
ncbi:hypothetical protein SAMN02745248_01912 [Hathewaya proteolytica DSM 3090]|uniref:DUF5050 domain-containing protein n=1 Tax=Hathewaya proteolytica DSM 3090 TaxID=1121331 RepID=A0A1M6Q6H7_9CLOT|nr:hypothetical protein [Hathewaya proteolytica]SHK15703.1 hypothetical protein SAMN02745248_01912 [Hathewaya proteolytica DSM 3090]